MPKSIARKQIREGGKVLTNLMRDQLKVIAQDYVKKVMSKARRATPAQMPGVLKDINLKGVTEYKRNLLDAFAALAEDGINQAKKEIGKPRKKLAEFDSLPPDVKKKLRLNVELLVGDQADAILKATNFSYLSNYDTTDSMDILEADLFDAIDDYLTGPAISAGADLTAATIISTARDATFDDPEYGENIEAFQFVNGDPVTAICTDLNGTVFAKDDPDRFRYTPPLHWNCKSYIVPILDLGKREIQKLKPSTQKIEDTIQFEDAFSNSLRMSILKAYKELEEGVSEKDKKWVQKKIEKLIDEGYTPEQATAVAYKMLKEKNQKKD